MTSSILSRYAAALLHIAIAIVGAFVLLPADAFASPRSGVTAGLSLLAVSASAVALYWAPLVGARESSVLKVAASVLGGVLAALVQFVDRGDYSSAAIGFLALAVLSGIAAKVGVDIRKDAELLEARRARDAAYNVTSVGEVEDENGVRYAGVLPAAAIVDESPRHLAE